MMSSSHRESLMSGASVGARPDRAALAAFMGVVLFGGLNAIGVRQTVLELAPFWGATLRFVIAGLVLAALVLATRRAFPRGRSLWGAVVYGVIGFAASFGFIYVALRDVPAGTATVLIALTPLFTFGLAIAHGQERFHIQGLVGGVIALAGIALVFADQAGASVPLLGLGLVVIGTICVAEAGVILKWIPRSDPFGTNAVAMLTGAAILGALSFLSGEAHPVPAQTGTWLAIGYLVVFGSVVMFSLYLFTLKRWTASAVSYATLLFPFVGVTVATLLTGERFTPAFALGGLVVLVGVYVGALRARPHRSSVTSSPECLPIDACAPPTPVRAASSS
jgi:O-acetylserine/cysteine efflux transporter